MLRLRRKSFPSLFLAEEKAAQKQPITAATMADSKWKSRSSGTGSMASPKAGNRKYVRRSFKMQI